MHPTGLESTGKYNVDVAVVVLVVSSSSEMKLVVSFKLCVFFVVDVTEKKYI